MTERSNAFYYLDLTLMETMCHPLAVAILDSKEEPMPTFWAHNTQLLQSSLGQPQQTFDGEDLYKTLVDKAMILYFSLIKNHCFQNGNKRMATASLLVFLWINDWWIQVGSRELADWTIKIADLKGTDIEQRNRLMKEFKEWLKKHLVARPESP